MLRDENTSASNDVLEDGKKSESVFDGIKSSSSPAEKFDAKTDIPNFSLLDERSYESQNPLITLDKKVTEVNSPVFLFKV